MFEQFFEDIKGLEEISIKKAEELTEKEERFVLFLGRPTCPYCRKFAPKIGHVSREYAIPVYFINSENTDELASIQAYRNKYGVKTVPGLVVSKASSVKVVCDSSLSEEAILEFIQN